MGEILRAVEIFGYEGAFWAMAIVITATLVGVWNPAAAFMLLAMSVVMVVSMGIVAIPWAAVAVLITVIVVMLWRTRS
jgi:hypothetical protein